MACKTLLFGFDGLDHHYLDQMMAEGLLPNFQKLRDESRQTALKVYPGMGAGAFWASGATGVTPADHGRYFFLQFNPKPMMSRLSTTITPIAVNPSGKTWTRRAAGSP